MGNNNATNQIELKLGGTVITTEAPLGVQKPGVVRISNRTIYFDEFVVGVSEANPSGIHEAMTYLLNWTRCRLAAQLPDPEDYQQKG